MRKKLIKKSSTTKLTKGQIIESQKDEEYWETATIRVR